MKNIENIKLVLKKIEENPESWKQSSWHCGTTHCFAGHGQIEAGKGEFSIEARVDARIFFGFTKDEADYYFDSARTLKELRTSTEDFYDGDGYGRDGYDREGFDHYGFNKKGYGRDGYDCDGHDADGLDIDNNSKSQ